MFKNYHFDTGEIHTTPGKVLEIIQEKKLSYTWNVHEYAGSPQTIVTWTLEPLDGAARPK